MLSLVPASGLSQESPQAEEVIRAIMFEVRMPALKWPRFPYYQDGLRTFYEPLYTPAWFENGQPRRQVAEILALLKEANDKGLSSDDYDLPWLTRQWQALQAGSATPQELARFDVALSLGLFQYISDLRVGRINPKRLYFDIDIQPKRYDLSAFIREAVAKDRLREMVAAAEPLSPVYRYLKQALATYKALAAMPLLPLPAEKRVRPGDTYAGTAALKHLLTALGDLPASEASEPDNGRYQGALVAAVKRFQERHGLAADGVLGPDAFAELNTPLAQRLRQIELALERMRWLPDPPMGPFIAVNIPQFKLWAFDGLWSLGHPPLEMGVIVGRSAKTRTPVFADQVEYLEFSPYWDVPRSIATKEILPILQRDPDYLARQGMELISTGGATYNRADEFTLVALQRGELRLRQRPSRRNALGGVKFMFPNSYNVYLHGTPVQRLFGRIRRDFSHGCVRVEDPIRLTQFLLADDPHWPKERIVKAMKVRRPIRVNLTRPVPILLFYTTALAEADGRIFFAQDLYGHDRRLDQALRKGAPYLP
jgi:murein L,D-transpeptidase YcbB/YkuD